MGVTAVCHLPRPQSPFLSLFSAGSDANPAKPDDRAATHQHLHPLAHHLAANAAGTTCSTTCRPTQLRSARDR